VPILLVHAKRSLERNFVPRIVYLLILQMRENANAVIRVVRKITKPCSEDWEISIGGTIHAGDTLFFEVISRIKVGMIIHEGGGRKN